MATGRATPLPCAVDVLAVLASIPSPGRDSFDLGPLHLRAYGLIIALGVYVAVRWARARWEARGGKGSDITDFAVWCVPAGLVGARVYHVITDWQLFRGRWIDVFKIWEGGLGVWGAVAGGTLAGLIVAQRRGLDKPALFDTVAPVIPMAQAIGRWGNWFNQELFGRPTDLPWALRIDPAHRPPGYEQYDTFHPTYLYESLWCLIVVGIVLFVERRFRLRPGRLFAVYVAAYTFGRFWIELMRIDPANRIAGLRVNDWVSVVVFAGAIGVLVVSGRSRPASTPAPQDLPQLEPEPEPEPPR
jgi:prolipoprotein diacylglyceryl transferase